MNHETSEMPAPIGDDERARRDRYWRKWKIATRVFFALLFVVETYFMVQYMTWREYIRWSAKGFAAGLAFTTALLVLVEIVKWWSMRKIRHLVRTAPELHPHAHVSLSDYDDYAKSTGKPTWRCPDCKLSGIGFAADHICPSVGPPDEPSAA